MEEYGDEGESVVNIRIIVVHKYLDVLPFSSSCNYQRDGMGSQDGDPRMGELGWDGMEMGMGIVSTNVGCQNCLSTCCWLLG